MKVAYLQRRVPHYRVPFFQELGRNLSDSNISLQILTCPFKEKGGSGIEPDYAALKRIHFFPKKHLSIFKNLFYQKGIIHYVKAADFDVVVVEGTLNNLSVWFLLLTRRLKKKKNIIWLKGWPNARNGLDYYIRKFFLSLANRCIVYGEISINLVGRYGVNCNKVTVAKNTVHFSGLIDDNVSSKISSDISTKWSKNNYILYFGRIVKKKKVIDLIKAFEKCSSECTSISLVIVGDGPEKASLESYLLRDSIDHVHFTGKVSDEDLHEIIRHSLFCVFPGAVGLSINQAMAAGKLVICADELGPDSELIKHEVTGIRFQKGNIEELKRHIAKFIKDSNMRKHIANKAKSHVLKNATISNMAFKHAKAVREVLL